MVDLNIHVRRLLELYEVFEQEIWGTHPVYPINSYCSIFSPIMTLKLFSLACSLCSQVEELGHGKRRCPPTTSSSTRRTRLPSTTTTITTTAAATRTAACRRATRRCRCRTSSKRSASQTSWRRPLQVILLWISMSVRHRCLNLTTGRLGGLRSFSGVR